MVCGICKRVFASVFIAVFGMGVAQAALACDGDIQKKHNVVRDKEKVFSVFVSENDIRERVKDVALKIRGDYQGKNPIFICVLSGAVMFFTDLVREAGIDCELDFIKISSYGDSTTSSGNVKIEKNLSRSIEGRDVIIVEDIIDSGLSMTVLRDFLIKGNPRSIRIAALFFKRETAKINFPIDYAAFEIPTSSFLIGYGLDYGQRHRELKDVYALIQ